jgi:hypothetical protein
MKEVECVRSDKRLEGHGKQHFREDVESKITIVDNRSQQINGKCSEILAGRKTEG